MSWEFPKTCSVIRRSDEEASLDIYGNPNHGTTTYDTPCDIQQIRRSEPGEAGEFSVTEWSGFFPSGTLLDTGDAISEATMGTFEVVGKPWDADQGSSAVNHMEATLKIA